MPQLPSHIDFADVRLKTYEENEQLYLGEAWNIFGIKNEAYFKAYSPSNPKLGYVNFNFFELVTNTAADFIKDMRVTWADKNLQEFFDDWKDRIGFDAKVYEAYVASSYQGDVVFKTIGTPDDVEPNNTLIDIFSVNPGIWFPNYNKNNQSLPARSHTLLTKKIVVENKKEISYYLMETYERGQILYQAYRDKGDKEVEFINPTDIFLDELSAILPDLQYDEINLTYTYKLPIDSLQLLEFVPNIRVSNKFFGISDYSQPIKAMCYSLNNNLTRVESVLMEFANPRLIVDESVIDQAIEEIQGDTTGTVAREFGLEDSTFASGRNVNSLMRERIRQVIFEKTRVFGMPADQTRSKPEFLTWDASLASSFEQIKNLKLNLMQQGAVAAVLIEPDAAMGQLSGAAIRRLTRLTTNKVKRKIRYMKNGLRNVLYNAMLLDKALNNRPWEVVFPSIEFELNFEDDPAEKVELHTKKTDAGFGTKLDAIKDIDDMTDEQAQKKLDEIEKEKQAAFDLMQEQNMQPTEMSGATDTKQINNQNKPAVNAK